MTLASASLPAPLPAPYALGLPSHYDRWRKYQRRAVWDLLDSPKRFSALVAPTGFGKSLTYAAYALLQGNRLPPPHKFPRLHRTCILTSTKAQQDQLTRDFESIGWYDVRGQSNYTCRLNTETGSRFSIPVSDGPCHAGFNCDYKESGCEYFDRMRTASGKEVVITNYAYWFWHGGEKSISQSIGNFDLLIMDEAHAVLEELHGRLSVSVGKKEVAEFLSGRAPGKDGWGAWARAGIAGLEQQAPEVKSARDYAALKVGKKVRDLTQRLSRIASIKDEAAWVVERTWGGWRWDIIDAAPLAEQYLFRETPRVVLVSATIRRKTLRTLGIKKKVSDIYEYPSTFPISRRPIYLFKSALPLRITYRTDEAYLRLWVSRIDSIIDRRLDRKGVIHTVSYARAQYLVERSRHKALMILHDQSKAQQGVEEFKAAKRGAILVSPAVSTGVDLPYEHCEYTIIAKVPFPDQRSLVIKARSKLDKDYGCYVAAQTMVQATGRGMRAEDDQCECVAPETKILTDDLRWVAAGDLNPGQRLLAFDENGTGRGHGRRWKWSGLTRVRTSIAPRMRVVLDDGEVICTPNHPWVVRDSGPGRSGCHHWKRTDQLTKRTKLVRLLTPWKTPDDYAAGWLAGFFDGEGCLVFTQGERNPNVSALTASQLVGPVLSQAIRLLGDYSFNINVGEIHRSHGLQRTIRILGGQPEILRFLGQIRPVRLLDKLLAHRRAEKVIAVSYPKVLAVERLADGPITSLQTETKTYVASGLAAHNTFIVDDQVHWFVRKYERYFAGWWLEAVRKVVEAPEPPERLEKRT